MRHSAARVVCVRRVAIDRGNTGITVILRPNHSMWAGLAIAIVPKKGP
jgi:hypothetical protein